MPSYHPAGEDGPNAMMAQAEAERRAQPKKKRGFVEWVDPVKPGWPGPMATWTPRQRMVFDRALATHLERGRPAPTAWAFAYGEVTRMPEGKA